MLIEQKGLERVGEPHVKHIEGRLWEMRMTGKSGISRAIYVTAVSQRVEHAAPGNRSGAGARETDQDDGEVTNGTYH